MDWSKILTSKRFWLSIIIVLTVIAGVVPHQVATYLLAGGTIITKILDLYFSAN